MFYSREVKGKEVTSSEVTLYQSLGPLYSHHITFEYAQWTFSIQIPLVTFQKTTEMVALG